MKKFEAQQAYLVFMLTLSVFMVHPTKAYFVS